MQTTEKTVRDPWGSFKRMVWTQIVSYTLALSSVVVCDWCGGLFGMWLQLGVLLGVFFLTHPPTTHLPFISATPDITAVSVKASQNQAGQTISDN